LRTMSYSDLANKVCQISEIMRQKLGTAAASEGTPPVVGLWFEHLADLTVAVLSTTTTGSTWLPFDPDAPMAWVKACLEDSKAAILLCNEAHYDHSCAILQSIEGCNVMRFNDLVARDDSSHHLTSEAQMCINPDDPAYLIYTSGSKSYYRHVLQDNLIQSSSSNSYRDSQRHLHSPSVSPGVLDVGICCPWYHGTRYRLARLQSRI
jgi:non-ribosomal peptide synthetase component F